MLIARIGIRAREKDDERKTDMCRPAKQGPSPRHKAGMTEVSLFISASRPQPADLTRLRVGGQGFTPNSDSPSSRFLGTAFERLWAVVRRGQFDGVMT